MLSSFKFYPNKVNEHRTSTTYDAGASLPFTVRNRHDHRHTTLNQWRLNVDATLGIFY